MAKVTSKLQVTIPKRLATRFGIRPGSNIQWEDGGEVIRIRPHVPKLKKRITPDRRLQMFDDATLRQRQRDLCASHAVAPDDRGWSRESL